MRLFLLLLVELMVLFALLRLGLILRNIKTSDGTWPQALPSFWYGLRFDFATACYLMIPVMPLCYIPWTAPWRGPRTRRIFLWSLTIFISVLAFILICEFEFFHEFQSRFNQLAIRYLDHPKIVGRMVWYNYPVVRYVLGWLVLAAAIHIALRLAMRWAYSKPAPPPGWRTLIHEAAGGLFIAAVIGFGCRGGFQAEPLAWGDAFRRDDEFGNQMSLNGLWSLGQAFRESFDRGKTARGWDNRMPDEEARQIVRQMILAPGEHLLDAKDRTILRTGNPGSSLVLKTADGRPINVVVVMMESFSARFVGATGAPRSFTPAFDELAKNGILFDHCLSAGSHTHQGIFATLLGFPNCPGYETLMSSGVANQEFLSIPAVFQAKGYKTMFLYNGDFSWDNMRGFFRKQGVDTFIGGDDMKADAKFLDPVWGVSDADLFDRANLEFDAAAKKGPFMGAIMTLSNHAPFEVPPVPGAGPITDMGDYDRRLEAMRYADYAVGKFIDDAKKLSYFNNTLFIFVGDHGFHVPPILTEVQLLFHHVPLLFYAPGLTERKGVDHRLASQMNILPSIVGLLGLNDVPHASWGRSLFDDSHPDENFAIFKMSGGGRAVAMAQGSEMLVLNSSKGEPVLVNFTLWPPEIHPVTPPNPARLEIMKHQLQAYVQAALNDLTNNRAGPMDARR